MLTKQYDVQNANFAWKIEPNVRDPPRPWLNFNHNLCRTSKSIIVETILVLLDFENR